MDIAADAGPDVLRGHVLWNLLRVVLLTETTSLMWTSLLGILGH